RLRAAGHDVVAPDLPSDDDSAGLSAYADAVVEATGDRSDIVVVAQSMGGLTAPMVCDRLSVRLIVLVAAMVPAPGETPGDWWANTGWEQPADMDDLTTLFFHDVPPEVTAEAMTNGRNQSARPFEE